MAEQDPDFGGDNSGRTLAQSWYIPIQLSLKEIAQHIPSVLLSQLKSEFGTEDTISTGWYIDFRASHNGILHLIEMDEGQHRSYPRWKEGMRPYIISLAARFGNDRKVAKLFNEAKKVGLHRIDPSGAVRILDGDAKISVEIDPAWLGQPASRLASVLRHIKATGAASYTTCDKDKTKPQFELSMKECKKPQLCPFIVCHDYSLQTSVTTGLAVEVACSSHSPWMAQQPIVGFGLGRIYVKNGGRLIKELEKRLQDPAAMMERLFETAGITITSSGSGELAAESSARAGRLFGNRHRYVSDPFWI